MIKKLRLRFIISALLSILFVLSATIATINIINYAKTENESGRLLNMITEHEHKDMQARMGMGEGGAGGGGYWPGGRPREDDKRNQEHYFTVVFNTDGEIWYSDYSHIFTIEDEAAQALATSVYQGSVTSGKNGNLRYKKERIKDVTNYNVTFDLTYVSFVDMTERMNSYATFLKNSIIISSVSFSLIAALIIISSHIVFKTSEESYRKQKAFITNASHELKTPLTIINTDVEILKMDHGDSEWTDSITDQVRRLTTMTNQLVTLSKLDEESMKNYPLTNISLTEIAKESINAFAATFEKNGFNFTSEVDNDLTIKGNRHLINELFYIFLDNALKYTKTKGDVDLSVKKNKNRVEINFSNDIEDDEVDVNQLFERFYRSPHSNKKEGSGIGLSIAKEIVDLHKAKITASIKNKKIHFVIVFQK